MKKHIGLFVLTVLLLCSLSSSAIAQTLYSNGPMDGQVDAFTINFGFQVSDSFTLSSAATVAGAQIGVWAFSGDTLTTVNWAIGTAPFDNSLGIDDVAVTNVLSSVTNPSGYILWEDTFPIGVPLAAGTYYLTLYNAVAANGNPIYWDENNGPSIAYDSSIGNLNGYDRPGTNSETFLVYGPSGPGPAGVPEPTTMLLLGLGLVGLAGVRRRFKQ